MYTKQRLSFLVWVIAMLFFGGYMYFDIIRKNVLLIDDLSLFRLVYELKTNPETFYSFFIKFISSAEMSARPISAFITGFLIYISQYNSRLYFISFAFFFLAIYSVFRVLKLYYKNATLAILGATVFATVPLASVITFSPIMLNANLAIFFYCFSLIYLSKHTSKSYVISSLLFVFSFLSYEVFLPFLVINILLMNSKKKSITNFLISISPLFLFIIYKNMIAPAIFNNANHRETPFNIFDIERDIKIFRIAAKTYFVDLPLSLIKAFKRMAFYSISDFIALIIFNILAVFFLRNQSLEVTNFRKGRSVVLLIITFILANSIYVMSEYRPSLFDFDNRTMAAIKFIGAVLIVNVILLLFKNTRSQKAVLSVTIAILSIFLVSAKNSWNYANDFNNKIFTQIKDRLPKNSVSDKVFVYYDYYNEKKFNPHLLMREPIYTNFYETYSLCKRNNISIPFYGKPFFVKRKNLRISKKNIDPDFKEFPYLIFSNSQSKIYTIKNLNDYILFLNNQ